MWSSLILGILLVVTNCRLIYYLNKKERVMSMQKRDSVYKRLKVRLNFICYIFVASFVVDIVYNLVVIKGFFNQEDCDSGSKNCSRMEVLAFEELYFITDPIPILVLMIFHKTNFRFVQ